MTPFIVATYPSWSPKSVSRVIMDELNVFDLKKEEARSEEREETQSAPFPTNLIKN